MDPAAVPEISCNSPELPLDFLAQIWQIEASSGRFPYREELTRGPGALFRVLTHPRSAFNLIEIPKDCYRWSTFA
jgi:hypothetical protein